MEIQLELSFREALKDDLPRLVKMLGEDQLGSTREDISQPLNSRYTSIFDQIAKDQNNELIVAEVNEEIVGMLQITFIPYLTHTGSWRCLIEGVRVHKLHRGKSFGTKLINWAIARAKERGCGIVQLTSDKKRSEAIRFYESLGFVSSHEGLKLKLTPHKGGGTQFSAPLRSTLFSPRALRG
jgi:ribosomal protein S18 acetylase RimI-like enzyme